MKTILVATDFSEAALTAAKYARSFATAFNSRLILFNAYEPLPGPAETLISVNGGDLKDYVKRNLLDQARAIDIHEAPFCYTDCEEGDAVSTIIRKAVAEKADIIVVGMKMEHKSFRKAFGSVASSLCVQSPVPVLVVPEAAEFKEPKTIALAFENDVQESVNPHLLDAFREIAERFHSSVFLVKIFGDELRNEMKFHHKPHRLIKMIRTTDPVFDAIDGNNVVEELLQYIENRDVDILATLSHKLIGLKKVFAKSVTRQLTFSAHIPLLICKSQ